MLETTNLAQPVRANLQPIVHRFSDTPSGQLARPRLTQLISIASRIGVPAGTLTTRINTRINAAIQTVQAGLGFGKQLRLQKIFTLFRKYYNPTFVRLFSLSDNKDKDPNTLTRLKNWLTVDSNGKHDINFDTGLPNQFGCKSMLDILKSKEILLEFPSLLGLWSVKMLNIDHDHFMEFVTAVGLLNFRHYEIKGKAKTILEKKIPCLIEEMETIKHIYSLLYLGLCLHMLINDKPTYIQKKRYFVQKYLRNILFGTNKNTNEVMYSIVYDRSLQFVSAKTGREHRVTIRCVFDVFRIQTVNKPITFMNISSCYIRNWQNRIRDKINSFLWASEKDDKILDIGSLTSEQKCELQKAEKKKFDFMLHYFKNFSIFDTLNAIYPNLETDVELQNTLKKMLNITSLNYDEVMKSYAHIISM